MWVMVSPTGGGESQACGTAKQTYLPLWAYHEGGWMSCMIGGAALGRVAMQTKFATSGKADVASPTRCRADSPA
jgi:hypothetical protein